MKQTATIITTITTTTTESKRKKEEEREQKKRRSRIFWLGYIHDPMAYRTLLNECVGEKKFSVYAKYLIGV